MQPQEIRDLRGERTQSEMARILGCAQATLSQWETGERTPRGPALTLLELVREMPELLDLLARLHPKKTP